MLLKKYKCPYCEHGIDITMADFINGIAVVSCTCCGKEAFTIETPRHHRIAKHLKQSFNITVVQI